MLLLPDMEPWRLSDEATALLSADETAPAPHYLQPPPPPPPPPNSLAAWNPEPWMLSEDAHTLLRAVADTPPVPAPPHVPAAEASLMIAAEQPGCRLSTRSWDGFASAGTFVQLPGDVVSLGARMSSI